MTFYASRRIYKAKRRIPDYLFEQPIVNVRLVEERVKCAFVTADKLLKQFAELGIVEEVTGAQRNRRYEYAPYLALFGPAEISQKGRE